MGTTQETLDSFHRFASEKLANGDSELSVADLYNLWRLENPTAEEQADLDVAISEGLADIKAGRTQSVDEAMRELRKKHNIPE